MIRIQLPCHTKSGPWKLSKYHQLFIYQIPSLDEEIVSGLDMTLPPDVWTVKYKLYTVYFVRTSNYTNRVPIGRDVYIMLELLTIKKWIKFLGGFHLLETSFTSELNYYSYLPLIFLSDISDAFISSSPRFLTEPVFTMIFKVSTYSLQILQRGTGGIREPLTPEHAHSDTHNH